MTNSRIKACLFDLYGTILDLQSVLALASSPLGELADPVLQLWRQKQLEYSWVYSLRGQYRDFQILTEDSLRFALAFHGVNDARVYDILISSYERLLAYEDVLPQIERMKEQGLIVGILSNGTTEMIARNLAYSGLENIFSPLLSVDKVRTFKPDMAVYNMASEALQLEPSQIMFVSGNNWDAAGAHQYGFHVMRIVREKGRPSEYQLQDVPTITSLTDLPVLQEISTI